jgi:hypothetical protein
MATAPLSITIDQLLMLAGRLDDAPGFDTPRERFRRFLLEHAGSLDFVRALIDQCQHAPAEQHQRALQDLVVLLGRFLGFEVQFGTYLPVAGAVRLDGQWLSRSRLRVVIDVRSTRPAPPGIDDLLRSVAAVSAAGDGPSVRPAGLCVLASYVGRHRVDEAVRAAAAPFPIGVVALRSLVGLAETVAAGGMMHDDVVRVIETNIPGDFIADLVERSAAHRPAEHAATIAAAAPPAAPAAAPAAGDAPSHWIATVGPEHAMRPEEFLELVVQRRRVFGVMDAASARMDARAGDWVCFHIAGRGVVGHARVTAITASAGGLRDAHRFRQLLQVDDVRLSLNDPVPLDSETELRMRTAGLVTSRRVPTLVRISRDSFGTFTAPRALGA